MILPVQPGPHPNMAVAAGKFGAMYLMDSNNLGGYNKGAPPPYPDAVFNAYTIGSCYCGESYFKATDGIGRVVSSGANTVVVWKVLNGANPALSQESISTPIVNGTNNGFFTTISSNGATAKSQVIWALGRPINTSPATVNLYAFDPSTVDASGKMATLVSTAAGSWPQHGRANLVPTVANGKVYVATYKQLAIFGLSGNSDVVSFTASGTQAAGVGPLPFTVDGIVPVALDAANIERIVAGFASAARRAQAAGFELLELHAAHGYLMHEFHSPLSNARTDRYGGSFENRIRFTLEVVDAVRAVWPERYPLFVRLSATDWVEGGWSIDESVALARVLGSRGVDLIDASSGGAVPDAKIPAAPGYQVPFAARIRSEAGIPTGAVGLITQAAQAEAIVANGSADLVFIARELLRDPYWPLHAAHELGVDVRWPDQYARAKPRARQLAGAR